MTIALRKVRIFEKKNRSFALMNCIPVGHHYISTLSRVVFNSILRFIDIIRLIKKSTTYVFFYVRRPEGTLSDFL